MNNTTAVTISNELPQQLSEAQLTYIFNRTPAIFIKSRVGRGGGVFAYVEIGYIIQVLNTIFGSGGWDWEYKLVEPLSYPNTKQIVVNGRLTVRIYDKQTKTQLIATLIKEASGGVEVKFPRDGKDPIDLADDLKAASADALKKAASYLGIANDVFYPTVFKAMAAARAKRQALPQLTEEEGNKIEEEVEQESRATNHNALLRTIFSLAKELAIKGKINLFGTDDQKKEAVKTLLESRGVKIASFASATDEELEFAVAELQSLLNE
jgi:hypothetical protein